MLCSGCGGAGGGEAWIPDDLRLASLQAVQDAFDARIGEDPDADNAALLAFIQTLPEFEASGLSEDGCVWARYTDGQLLIIANNRQAPEDPPPTVPSIDMGRAPSELPRFKDITFLNAMGSMFLDPTPNLQPLVSNGYQIVSTDVTVEGLKTNVYGNDGVFYIDTHGGTGEYRTNDEYALATGTVATPTSLDVYKTDLRKRKLTYFIAEIDELNGVPISEKRLAITQAFVREYMFFRGNCLVYVDACNSDNASLKQAFLDRGASVYVGWTNYVNDQFAFNANAHVFKRLASTGTDVPATYPTIKSDMALESPRLDLDPWKGAELIFTANLTAGAGDFGLLAPKITTVTPDRTANTLLLVGVFGQNPGSDGSVKVGGTAISVTSWQPFSILCSLPATGAGSSGGVIVTVRGHASNTAGPVAAGGGNGDGNLPFWEDAMARGSFIDGTPFVVKDTFVDGQGNITITETNVFVQYGPTFFRATADAILMVYWPLTNPTPDFVESPIDDYEPHPGRPIWLTERNTDGSFTSTDPDNLPIPDGGGYTVLSGNGQFTFHYLTRGDGSKYTAVSLDLIYTYSDWNSTYEIHSGQRYVREGWVFTG